MKRMQKPSSNREPLLTTAAVAKWLGVATRTLCLWAECREIPAIKIGRQWRFREGDLREWLDSPQAAKVGIGANHKNSHVSGATA
jgi:excisionase family DNA binding protein